MNKRLPKQEQNIYIKNSPIRSQNVTFNEQRTHLPSNSITTKPDVSIEESQFYLHLKHRYMCLKEELESSNVGAAAKEENKKKLLSTIDLVKTLSETLCLTWNRDREIGTFYKAPFFAHLKHLPLVNIVEALKSEIQKTESRTSMFYIIQADIKTREQILADLKRKLNKIEIQQHLTIVELGSVCGLLARLRGATLKVVETVWAWRKENALTKDPRPRGPQLPYMYEDRNYLQKLRGDTIFLGKSFLRNFIAFSSSADPFFLHPYRLLISSQDSAMQHYDCILELFNLNFETAYKLNQADKDLQDQKNTLIYPPLGSGSDNQLNNHQSKQQNERNQDPSQLQRKLLQRLNRDQHSKYKGIQQRYEGSSSATKIRSLKKIREQEETQDILGDSQRYESHNFRIHRRKLDYGNYTGARQRMGSESVQTKRQRTQDYRYRGDSRERIETRRLKAVNLQPIHHSKLAKYNHPSDYEVRTAQEREYNKILYRRNNNFRNLDPVGQTRMEQIENAQGYSRRSRKQRGGGRYNQQSGSESEPRVQRQDRDRERRYWEVRDRRALDQDERDSYRNKQMKHRRKEESEYQRERTQRTDNQIDQNTYDRRRVESMQSSSSESKPSQEIQHRRRLNAGDNSNRKRQLMPEHQDRYQRSVGKQIFKTKQNVKDGSNSRYSSSERERQINSPYSPSIKDSRLREQQVASHDQQQRHRQNQRASNLVPNQQKGQTAQKQQTKRRQNSFNQFEMAVPSHMEPKEQKSNKDKVAKTVEKYKNQPNRPKDQTPVFNHTNQTVDDRLIRQHSPIEAGSTNTNLNHKHPTQTEPPEKLPQFSHQIAAHQEKPSPPDHNKLQQRIQNSPPTPPPQQNNNSNNNNDNSKSPQGTKSPSQQSSVIRKPPAVVTKRLQLKVTEPKIPVKQLPQYLQKFTNPAYLHFFAQKPDQLKVYEVIHSYHIVSLLLNQDEYAVFILNRNRRKDVVHIKHYFCKTSEKFFQESVKICTNFVLLKDPTNNVTFQLFRDINTDMTEYKKFAKMLSNVGYSQVGSRQLQERTVELFNFKRVSPFDKNRLAAIESSGTLGFSIRASNLMVPKNSQTEFESDQIQGFSAHNYCSDILLVAFDSSLQLSLGPQELGRIQQNISRLGVTSQRSLDDLARVNQILQAEGYDTYQSNKKFNQVSLARFQLCRMLGLPFVVQNNYALFMLSDPTCASMYNIGEAVILILNLQFSAKISQGAEKTLVPFKLVLLKGSPGKTTLLQAKSAFDMLVSEQFVAVSKQTPNPNLNKKVGVHFFNKQIYGRLQNTEAERSSDKSIYGNVQVSFLWRDFLQGRVLYTQSEFTLFSQPMSVALVCQESSEDYSALMQFLLVKDDMLLL